MVSNKNETPVVTGDPDYINKIRDVESQRIYSPQVRFVQYTAKRNPITIPLNVSPQIRNMDVLNITNTMGVEQITCNITLNNRKPANSSDGYGIYTYRPGTNNFTGVKPIVVKYGIQRKDPFFQSDQGKVGGFGIDADMDGNRQGDNMITRFRGFVVRRQYQRAGTNKSQCLLSCVDATLRARDTYAVNLPIFDGWCHLSAIYVLGKEAGYTDDQLLVYQNPNDETDLIKLRDVIEATGGNCDTWQGSCFDGHVYEFPSNIYANQMPDISGEVLHTCLPLMAFKDNPKFMFALGTPIWQCMNEIREYSGFYLYANHFGNIIYQPPCAAGFNGDSGGIRKNPVVSYTFFETPMDGTGMQVDPGNYNEVLRNLDVTNDTTDVRNAVMTQGLLDASKDAGTPIYTPFISVKRQENFPYNVNDQAYIPWLRWVIVRNPMWNDPARIMWANEMRFRRAIRPRIIASWTGWGQPWLFPYMLVQVREIIMNETGIESQYAYKDQYISGQNKGAFIITSMTDTLNAEDFTYYTSFEGELFQSGYWEFYPHEL